MARGFDRHIAHSNAVAALGRGLSRRARNRCELCGTPGSLRVVEVPPTDETPDPERAIIVCDACGDDVLGGRGPLDGDRLRCLSEVVWADVLPVQLAAVRLVRKLSDGGEGWARHVLDGLYLDPSVEELL